MRVDAGGISAKCFVCSSNDFEPLRPRAGEPSDKLACIGCGAKVFYDDLLSQIGRTAIARRKASHIPGQPTAGSP